MKYYDFKNYCLFKVFDFIIIEIIKIMVKVLNFMFVFVYFFGYKEGLCEKMIYSKIWYLIEIVRKINLI